MDSALLWLVPIMGYLLGSILPADFVVRAILGNSPAAYGENFGTAATWRLVGPLPAIAVFLYDFFKGFFPVFVASSLRAPDMIIVLSAVAPVLGHNWPAHRRFRGGRGMAAAIGAIVFLAPRIFVPSFLVGAAVALYKRRTPWVAFVGLPVGLLLILYFGIPAHRLAAILAVCLLLLIRQLQWGNWS